MIVACTKPILIYASLDEMFQNVESHLSHGHVPHPSPIVKNQMNTNNSFINEFMRHLQQEQSASVDVTIKGAIGTNSTEQKLPKKPRKPRDPSAVKKPRKIKETDTKKCTTIGLQIQIRDPSTEPVTASPLETSFESTEMISMYPFKSNEIGETVSPTKLISNSVEQYIPASSSVNQTTYYNINQTECVPAVQMLYEPELEPEPEPEPEPVYHSHNMNLMTNECVSVSNPLMHTTNPNHLGNDCPATHQSYSIYSEQQKNNAALLSHFNVSHTNVNNNASIHNWRAGNEIM